MLIKTVYAAGNEIVNLALPTNVQTFTTSGQGLAFYIAQLWKTAVILGGIGFLLYLIWGGLELLVAAGDKGRVENGQQKIVHALIGLLILVGSYAIIALIQGIFQINLLAPIFPDNR